MKNWVKYISFVMIVAGIMLISGINSCVSLNANDNSSNQSKQGLQIILKDPGLPEVKYMQPTINEIQLQNGAGNWITIWSSQEGKTVKLTSDGAEASLDTVSVPAGTYVATRMKVSKIDVEADVNRDGDTSDTNVEVILTLDEFNSLPQQDKPQAPVQPQAPEQPQAQEQPQAPEQPQNDQPITDAGTGDSLQEQPQAPEQPQQEQPQEPQAPEQPQAPYTIKDGLVYMGQYLDEVHTATPPFWDGITAHYGEYLYPLLNSNFVYDGKGGKIIYDFTLHPTLPKDRQVSVAVSVTA